VRANRDRLAGLGDRLDRAQEIRLRQARDRQAGLQGRLRPMVLTRALSLGRERLDGVARLLDSLSFERVLERGYVLVRDSAGAPVTRRAKAPEAGPLTLRFADGALAVQVGEASAPGRAKTAKAKPAAPPPKQGDLF